MPNVYVEPQPKGQPEGTPITHYVLELTNGVRMDQNNYKTQSEAVAAAFAAFHEPLLAQVRDPDKGKREHWRPAEANPSMRRRSWWRK